MIIPGFIGGRMVKWLSEITVTEEVRRRGRLPAGR
jgi:DMSO/TMAO reductase YedYZ molybdopterin-dependent catalytic subunit